MSLGALLSACGGGGTDGGGGGAGGGGGGGWTITTADATSSDVGVNPSLALDAAGTVHVCHLDRANNNFRYARLASGVWTRSTVGSAAGQYVDGKWCSLAVSTAGVPSVVYHHSDVAYVYAQGNAAGTAWTTSDIPFLEAAWAFLGHSAVAIDPSNATSIHVGLWLYNSYAGYLPAHWKPGDSSATRVDGPIGQGNAGHNGIHVSIAVDPSGKPHLSFLHGEVDPATKTYMAWAEPSGSTFVVHDIEEAPEPSTATPSAEKWSAIAIDAAGRPHIFYYRLSPGAGAPAGYRYAYWNGTAWTIETVGQNATGYTALALALDASGVPHVAFYGPGSHVYYGKRTGPGAWATEVVDSSSNDTGDGMGIAVDSTGHVHISYHDATVRSLKYATR